MYDIIEVLKNVGEIEHWTRRPHSDACGPEFSYPPIVTWRYKCPPADLAAFILSA